MYMFVWDLDLDLDLCSSPVWSLFLNVSVVMRGVIFRGIIVENKNSGCNTMTTVVE